MKHGEKKKGREREGKTETLIKGFWALGSLRAPSAREDKQDNERKGGPPFPFSNLVWLCLLAEWGRQGKT